jgi:hypothetical protein
MVNYLKRDLIDAVNYINKTGRGRQLESNKTFYIFVLTHRQLKVCQKNDEI